MKTLNKYKKSLSLFIFKKIKYIYGNYSYSESWLILLKCFILKGKFKKCVGLHTKSVAQITLEMCCDIWNKPQVVELLSCKPCEVVVNCTFWSCGHILLLLGYCSMRMDAASADCSREQNVFMSHQICCDHDLILQSLISSDGHDLGLFSQQLLWNILSLPSTEMMSPVLMTNLIY